MPKRKDLFIYQDYEVLLKKLKKIEKNIHKCGKRTYDIQFVFLLVGVTKATSYSKLKGDNTPLTKKWLLVSSPWPLLGILVIYNVFCINIGPKFMKNRSPYKLETPIKLYNIIQVLISLYITYEGFIYLFSGDFNFQCQGVRQGEERVARAVQVYLMTKLLELLDTVFFVFRKSDRQITFLHLYHHTLMPVVSWIGLKYYPGGQSVLFGSINSLVHVFMYSYYLLSGFGHKFQKYLWWKKYLTLMQIVQFIVVFLHSCNSLFYSCDFPFELKILTIIFSLIFLHMFGTFFYRSYVINKPSRNDHLNNGTNEADKSYDQVVSNQKTDTKDGHPVNEDLKPEFNGTEMKKTKLTNGTSNGSKCTNGKQFTGKAKDL